ncbi:MAG: cation diffusion facilitator family transporter [Anaerovoracaceae bacterium]|jgi:cation diffusion facilitator family transporter
MEEKNNSHAVGSGRGARPPLDPAAREKKIIRTSVIGILVNVLLAGFKAAVGLIAGSVAIVLDAVNNLSDAMSSLITIIGTKLAAKAPDKKHPLGHGRVEYLSASVIALIVLYAGISALVESVKKILHPTRPEYTYVALIIVAVAVVVKILLGQFVKKTGEAVDSGSLIASGKDAMFDSIISASTLLAAVIFMTTGISLEAWLGAVIALVIIKAGLEMLRDAVSEILGERIDPELSRRVKQAACEIPPVIGAYDLVIHAYGPNRLVGSMHIEVPDTMTVRELDSVERKIIRNVFEKTRVIMTGISIYSQNTSDDRSAQIERRIRDVLDGYEHVLQMHGFYVNEEEKWIMFDIIIDFNFSDAEGRRKLYREIREEIQKMFPDYELSITLDFDISD